jgi:hypothetical protein
MVSGRYSAVPERRLTRVYSGNRLSCSGRHDSVSARTLFPRAGSCLDCPKIAEQIRDVLGRQLLFELIRHERLGNRAHLVNVFAKHTDAQTFVLKQGNAGGCLLGQHTKEDTAIQCADDVGLKPSRDGTAGIENVRQQGFVRAIVSFGQRGTDCNSLIFQLMTTRTMFQEQLSTALGITG